MPQVTLSFTSTPDRVTHIEPMIRSIEEQSYSNFTAILWLCRHYQRSGKTMSEKQIPHFISSSKVEVRFCDDYGSNTKLLPTLQQVKDPQALIVTADDDTLYPKDWLKGLVEASEKNPSAAYGYRGKMLKKRTFPFFKHLKRAARYEDSKTLILPHSSKEQEVDLLTGVWGICYRRSFFKEDYFKLQQCPAALHNDDIWANGHLARHLIKRICIGSPSNFKDIDMEREGVARLWDSVNNGRGLNNKVFKYFKHDF